MGGSRMSRWSRGRAALAALLVLGALILGSGGTAQAGPTALGLGSGQATVTGPPPVTMAFPLGRAGDLGFDVWLRYRTEDGTAAAGSDYTAAGGELLMPAGASAASVPVGILGKSAYAPDKQFALELSSATGVGPTPNFAERVSFTTGASVSARAAVGDLNGDGRPDVIVPDDSGGAVSILLDTTDPGSSTPRLSAPQSFAVGGDPEPATPIDINGDGRPDLVVADSSDDEFSVRINTTPPGASTLSFSPVQTFEAGRGPSHPTLVDVNGDGRPDLVLANDQFDEHAISVFFNTTPPGATTASFGPRQYFEFFAPGSTLETDVNGDGRPDFVISSQGGADEVVVILNQTPPGGSALVLGPEADIPVDRQPNIVRAADLNGDGMPDLAVSNLESNSVSVLVNETVPGSSTPSFAGSQSFAVNNGPRSLQAVDLNGDGRPDLVAASYNNHSLSVLVNTTPPGASRMSFTRQTFEAQPLPLGLEAPDLNGDGKRDLVYTNPGGKVSVAMNTTPRPTAVAPSMAAKQDASAGGGPSAVTSVDFNGDGKPDVAVPDHDEGVVSVLLDATAPGAAAPTFAGRGAFPVGDAPSGVADADFNLDGRPDLAVADEGGDAASVLLDTTTPGGTTPSFAPAQSFSTGHEPSAITAADFNLDGKPDLAVADRGTGDVSVLLDNTAPGASAPTFLVRQSFPVGAGPVSVAAADVNLDGKPDLVVANRDDDTASVLLNTTVPGSTTATFAPAVAFATGSLPSSIAVADINGDARPDLVVADEGSDSVSVLFNTTAPGAASPSFSTGQAFAAGHAPSSVAIADLDGDGIPDLLVADRGADTASVLLNTTQPGSGAPSFAERKAFATGAAPIGVTAADLNGDGGLDVIAADGSGDAISALLDTQYTASLAPASVTGTIHYGIPAPQLEPGSLDFGAQSLNATATKVVTVTNEGGADLAIGGIAIAPDGTGFAQTNDCPATLPAGSRCSIAVSFVPGVTGAASAALTVSTGAPIGRSVVALSGSGVASIDPARPGVPLRSSQTPARLRIGKVIRRTKKGRLWLAVRGTIAAGARGRVAVRAWRRGRGRWRAATRQVKIAGGRWSTRLVLTAGADPGSPIRIAARFGGSAGFEADHAERRLGVR